MGSPSNMGDDIGIHLQADMAAIDQVAHRKGRVVVVGLVWLVETQAPATACNTHSIDHCV